MATSNTDTGVTELDKLIHNLEFENQQYVKMIENENQLISSLESQIEEKTQQTLKLEQDISRFDEDTRWLHRHYTNNMDNIESLKNTINVLSDHETALSRQLEVTRSKTEESRKLYEAQLANYSSVRDDYMKKYTSFPLAIELHKKKQALAAAQKKLDDIKAMKQDLEDRIASKESELDSKIMTRIMVKIAKTQLATIQLRKDIDERLAEKADLIEKLKEIQTTKHTGQDEQCRDSYEDGGDIMSMEVDGMEHMADSHRQKSSVEVEGFSNMSITDGHQRCSVGDGEQHHPHLDTDEMSMEDSTGSHCQGEISNTVQGKLVPGINVVDVHPSSAQTQDGGQIFTTNDAVSGRKDLNKSAASDQINMEKVVAEKQPEVPCVMQAGESLMPGSGGVAKLHFSLLPNIRPPPPTRIPVWQNFGKSPGRQMAPELDTEINKQPEVPCVMQAGESLMPGSSRVAKLHFSLLPNIRPPLSTHIPVWQNFGKVSGRQMAPELDTEINRKAGDMNAVDALKSSSDQASQICIPRLPRVLPPPPVHTPHIQKQFKLPEKVTPPESCSKMTKVPPPPANLLQDFRQKMSLLLPKPAQRSSSTQQNEDNKLSKTTGQLELTSITTEKAQADHRPWSLQFSSNQVSQFHTAPSGPTTETSTPKQVSGTSLPANQQKPSSKVKKMTVEKPNTSTPGSVKIPASTEFSVSTSIKTTDVEVPTKGSDSPPSEPESCLNLFSVNIQRFNTTETSTQSPTRKYSKFTNRRRPPSEGSHSFLLESLFGNFDKKLNEDTYESDEEAAPTSIFHLFNISQNSGNGTHDDSKDAGSFFTFGKFTENTESPSPEGPSSLLNLFTKSQTSDVSSRDFAMNIQEDDKENEMSAFKLGVAVDERNESNEEPEKTQFNLF